MNLDFVTPVGLAAMIFKLVNSCEIDLDLSANARNLKPESRRSFLLTGD